MRIRCLMSWLCSLILLGLILSACVGSQSDTPVGKPDKGSNQSEVGGPMVIEGVLIEVMESWPLQLTIAAETGRYHVELLEETMITREGEVVDPGILRPDLQVRVEGQASSSNAMTARIIKILTENR